jgi:DNA-binding Lrp family transcriptional regulator
MMKELLKLLETNAKLTDSQLSALLDLPEEEIRKEIEQYEKGRIILGYNALINWEKVDADDCTAYIEVKVRPKRDRGYEKIAEEITHFEEVEPCWLMSSSSTISPSSSADRISARSPCSWPNALPR